MKATYSQQEDEPVPLVRGGPSQADQVEEHPADPDATASPDSPALNHDCAVTMLHYLRSLSQDDDYKDLVAQLRPVCVIYFCCYISVFVLTWGQTVKPLGLCQPPFMGELGLPREIPSCRGSYKGWLSGVPGCHP